MIVWEVEFLRKLIVLHVLHCKTKGPFGFTIFLCKTKIVRTKEVNTSLRCGFCGKCKTSIVNVLQRFTVLQ